jgi:hypothetical protein
VWSAPRMVAVYYFANIGFALLFALPVYLLLDRFADQSFLGMSLADRLDAGFLVEFVRYDRPGTTALAAIALLFGPLYWVAGLFLSGGAYASFSAGARSTPYRPVLFWGGAARYFGRFVRLALLSIAVCAVLLSLLLLEKGIETVLFGSDPHQYVDYWGGWVRTGLGLAGIFLSGVLLDFARVHTVLAGERRMRTALAESVRFTGTHPGAAAGLGLSILAVCSLIIAGYAGAVHVFAFSSVSSVVLLILLQQAVVLVLVALRLTLYASQLELFRALDRREGSRRRVLYPDPSPGAGSGEDAERAAGEGMP